MPTRTTTSPHCAQSAALYNGQSSSKRKNKIDNRRTKKNNLWKSRNLYNINKQLSCMITHLEHRCPFSCGISEVQISENDFTTHLMLREVTLISAYMGTQVEDLKYRLRRFHCLLRFRCQGYRSCQSRRSKGNSYEGSVISIGNYNPRFHM